MRIILSILLLSVIVPTTQGTDEKAYVNEALEIKFVVPTQWKPIDAPPHENKKLNGVSFDNVDTAGSLVAIQSTQQDRKIDAPAQRVAAMLNPHRDAAQKRKMRVTDDREVKIAGNPGWIFEAQNDEFTTVAIGFVISDREYLLICAGQTDCYQKIKSALMKLISTIEPLAAEK